ncbi:MAG: 2-oxoacid:acceptor oxidoreductase subunit alpha [Caldilineaceae bacterium]|nr:2-oxoacid:acceptor oxidoreductase subunit alpha [Caldilineaceae bacterium]
MEPTSFDFVIGIGGAAGQGIATPGNILARIFVRRGLHLYAYNAHQSIIRGGHILLAFRVANHPIYSHGDKLDLLLCLNQDTMTRHLRHMGPGSWVLYNSDDVVPGEAGPGVHLCPMPIGELTNKSRNKVIQNTVALGAILAIMGQDFATLAEILEKEFGRKGQEVVDENVGAARAGFEHAQANFQAMTQTVPVGPKPLAVWSGNEALAMGGAAAGVKFYSAYPMSPSTGVLHWMAANARDLGIIVRQGEDELAVANMAIGAAHTGCRSMCATSGGGFALMTEAIGMAGMMEVPVVIINVQRAGPSTGVPTKTEQGDLWQALGASQGDFERFIVAPTDALDAFNTIAELFNLADKCQCPGIVLTDLLISEGTFSVDPDAINMQPRIDRGALIPHPVMNGENGVNGSDGANGANGTHGYMRYLDTETGISPRALPGMEGYIYVAASDEHDEEGILISDEFTNPIKRRQMVEKRARKFQYVAQDVPAPQLEGPADASVTLVGFGSTYGVIKEAIDLLAKEGVSANQLAIKWIVPFHADEVSEILGKAKRIIIVENNYSGQFARYLRSETGIAAHGHIRKYDGEPFLPHHIVEAVQEQLAGKTDRSVPVQEYIV